MSFAEMLLSLLPMFLALAIVFLILRKMGAFELREHRRRVEALLERIAVAVEKGGDRTLR
jgi:uncharacterized membrane protein YdjX (TVP38/TMEM64 family)